MDFYKPIFIENRERIVASKFKLVRLGAISTKITKGETPLWKGDEYQEKGILFVKSENVLRGSLSLSKSVFIDDDVHQRMNRSQLKKGDVLLNIVGASIGRSCVYDRSETANINQAVCLIRPSKDVNPHWLCTVLNSEPFQTVLDQIKSGGARDNIDLYQVRALKVPFSPLDIQNHIAEMMQSAYAQKKQKEQEADALLDSIDDYVLAELGVEMPAVEEKKCFVVYPSETAGRRVDPLYLKNISHFRSIKTPYSLTPLGKLLIDKPEYGANERAINGNPETDVRYIRITDIDDYGNLLNDDWKTAETIHPKYLLQENDVLFARSGSAGRAFVYKSQLGKAIFAGYLIRFKFDSAKVNPSFVFYYTLTKMYKLWVQSIQRTAVQANINAKEFQSLEIPLAPLDVQNRIVEEANKRLSHVAQLRQEADAIVEEAKREVERVML